LPDVRSVPLTAELLEFKGETATYRLHGQTGGTHLQITGQHNFQNAAAALALAYTILPTIDPIVLIGQLSEVLPAFGRGESFFLKNGSEVQLNLVKNPASFRQGLASYAKPDTAIMIAINDHVADSRDVSWLWDVDMAAIKGRVIAMTAGSRAADMALRLQYEDKEVAKIEPDIEKALKMFCTSTNGKVIFATYTAMLRLHALLSKRAGKDL